jgi:long-chain acyl-CoA synthetase
MTECAPVICANRPRDNVPASVGAPIPGVQVRIGEYDALLVKGPNVMLGYWGNPEATGQIMMADGWLNTGDTVRIDSEGHVYITGRLKEIIVMSNGEKVPPVDVENAILRDSLFEQVMLLGEGKPYLTALAVLNADRWHALASENGLDAQPLASRKAHELVVQRIAVQLKPFPGYAQVRRVALTLEPWTIENGMLTPTMKLKRARVMEKFNAEIDRMYVGRV